jgi:hypothetical protein
MLSVYEGRVFRAPINSRLASLVPCSRLSLEISKPYRKQSIVGATTARIYHVLIIL